MAEYLDVDDVTRTEPKPTGDDQRIYRIEAQGAGVFDSLAQRSIVDAAIGNGREFPHGCRSGHCGACHARLLQGEVRYLNDYRPPPLPEQHIVCCQATPVADIRLQPLRSTLHWSEPHTRSVSVAALRLLAPDVLGLWLRLVDNPRFDYRPGQYVDIRLNGGWLRRCSVAGARMRDGLLEFHIGCQPWGYEWLSNRLQAGERLEIEGPLGRFYLRDADRRPIIMIAAGVGFAAIKSLLEQAVDRGLGASIHLYRAATTGGGLYHTDDSQRWLDSSGIRVTEVVVQGDSDGRRHADPAHMAVLEDYPDLSGHDLYMAGPAAMLQVARDDLLAFGLNPERLFVDRSVVAGKPSLFARIAALWAGNNERTRSRLREST